VRLTVSYKPDNVALRIVNEGALITASSAGRGLNGMRERATALGSTLQSGAAPDGTFVVTAILPVEPAA
jgi:signal transduction histidine kinase